MASTMMAQNEVQDYGYNTRDELISGQGLTYNYDDIGNRTTAEGKTYTANELNQYTAIDSFTPQYDADGNQTLIKTSTGIWSVTYNAENRPVRWESGDTVITMNFDRMGRRVFYKEEVAGVVTKHHKFVYDNYLCVQKVDALNNNSQINLFVWDPTEPVATRPLFTQRGTGYKFFYTCDGNKNVSELVHFETRNGIAAHYDYAPFGAVTRAISASAVTDNTFTTDNPFRFSSEYHDDTLGLVYYNYRHYNLTDGRWCGRDVIEEDGGENLYLFVVNQPQFSYDYAGMLDLGDDFLGNYCGRKRVNGKIRCQGQEGVPSDMMGPPYGLEPENEADYCCLYHDICLAKVDENYLVNSEAKRRAQKDCDSRLTVCWAGATLCPGKTPFIERVKVLFLGIPAMATAAHPIPPEIRSHEDGRNVEVRFTILLFQF